MLKKGGSKKGGLKRGTQKGVLASIQRSGETARGSCGRNCGALPGSARHCAAQRSSGPCGMDAYIGYSRRSAITRYSRVLPRYCAPPPSTRHSFVCSWQPLWGALGSARQCTAPERRVCAAWRCRVLTGYSRVLTGYSRGQWIGRSGVHRRLGVGPRHAV